MPREYRVFYYFSSKIREYGKLTYYITVAALLLVGEEKDH